jgi:hypothetical protein
MDILLQKGLRDGSLTLESLEKDLGIAIRRHQKYPNLVGLSYDQILSPLKHPVADECRGIILDESDNWNIVARPFSRFYNHGQFEDNIDWKSAKVQEKVDGSLALVYHYDNQWHMATRGSPDASGPVGSSSYCFNQLFWETWGSMGMEQLDASTRHLTYLFELTGPMNRVVVNYPTSALTLLGVRSILTGTEINPQSFKSMKNWQIVREFPLTNLENILASFDAMNPLEQEGYVIVDKFFNRVKVKHPGYIALHKLRDSFSPKNVLDMVRTGQSSELIANFPEMKEMFDVMTEKHVNLIQDLILFYEEIEGIPVQKDFAMEAIKHPLSSALFAFRSGKIKSFQEFIKEMNIDKLYEVLNDNF